MTPPPLKALLVDDEAPARTELRRLLSAHPEVQVVGEAATVDDAIQIVGSARPDVVFLDIALGRRTGFDLLAQIDDGPDVVFVTAYEEHALRAFEVNALSYLLKPVFAPRLAEVIARLTRRTAPSVPPPVALESEDYLLLEVRGRRTFVRVSDVRCIRSEGNYSRLVVPDGEALTPTTLAHWVRRLPARRFAQIHRSTIVNLDHVERIDGGSTSAQVVILKGIATPLAMSRRHAARLQEHFS